MSDNCVDSTSFLLDPTEDICRLCFSAEIPITQDSKHPNQVDSSTNMLYLEELSWTELAIRGFSVQRVALYSREEAEAEPARKNAARLERKGIDPKFNLLGVLIARVDKINEIVETDGLQVFTVAATPGDNSPAHAEIKIEKSLLENGFRRDQLLRYRVALQKALGKVRSVNSIPFRRAQESAQLLAGCPATPSAQLFVLKKSGPE